MRIKLHGRLIWLSIASLWIVMMLAACGDQQNELNENTNTNDESMVIVASTSWVSMIARAAGAEDVAILAPVELRHPPEYDFKPSDIERVNAADYVVYAGYEPFMNKLLETVDVADDQKIYVRTENTPDNLKEQVNQLAELFGTETVAEQWVTEMDELVKLIEAEADAMQLSQQKVVVQDHMVPLAEFFGYDVIAEFTEELSPVKIAELAALEPDLVIDNYHNVQGKGIAEVAQVPRVELRNFPANAEDTIQDLWLDNAEKLGMNIEWK